jgi:quercetin 2,3-dioxygenase
MKTIQKKYTVGQFNMVGDGFRVYNYLPGPFRLNEEASPFLFLDYNEPFNFLPTAHRKGVGEHPHRGFETVTIVYEGELEHRDSSGGGGFIKAGDVQWMTAGNGVMHDEFQTEHISKNGGIQHMMQIWVNLPAAYRKTKPGYQSIESNKIPSIEIGKNQGVVRVIAGELNGVKGAASTFSPIEMYDIRMQQGASFSCLVPKEYNTMLLITKGSATIQNQPVVFKDFVYFNHDGEQINIEATEDCFVFIMAGEPLNEPIFRYGPFVMGSKEEIMESIEMFNKGEFGRI